MLECLEQEGPAASGGTQIFQSVSLGELPSAVWREKAARMSAWRTGYRSVFLILPVPTAGGRIGQLEIAERGF